MNEINRNLFVGTLVHELASRRLRDYKFTLEGTRMCMAIDMLNRLVHQDTPCSEVLFKKSMLIIPTQHNDYCLAIVDGDPVEFVFVSVCLGRENFMDAVVEKPLFDLTDAMLSLVANHPISLDSLQQLHEWLGSQPLLDGSMQTSQLAEAQTNA